MTVESLPLHLWTFGWHQWFGCSFCKHVSFSSLLFSSLLFSSLLFSSLCPLPIPLCPGLRCWSLMQLASQKGQQTCGHRESGSCQGRLSWGCPSSRAVWVSWQRKGWGDSGRESERGRTSVPTTAISCRAAQSVDLRSGGNQPLVVSRTHVKSRCVLQK